MRIISPHQAIELLKSFISAVDRLENDRYKIQAMRTRDLSKVKNKFAKLGLIASVAILNKNEQRAYDYVKTARQKRDLALKYLKPVSSKTEHTQPIKQQ